MLESLRRTVRIRGTSQGILVKMPCASPMTLFTYSYRILLREGDSKGGLGFRV